MRSADRMAALAAFLFLVVPLVAYCAWRVPTGQVPDEPTHVIRAASLLRGEIIGHRIARPNVETGAPDAGVTGNTGLALAAMAGNGDIAPLPAGAARAARLAWVRAIPWQPQTGFISSANTAAYSPMAYIPAALGLGAAILMGANPHAAIIAARFANTLVFALIGLLALALAKRGRLLLLITLSLPMTVWLAGSCSQDGVVIASTVLGTALLLRDEKWSFWCGCAAIALLVLQKPPFLPLALLPLLGAGRFDPQGWRRRGAGAVLVAMPGMLWSVAVAALVSVPLLPGQAYQAGPLWPGNPGQLFRSAVASAQVTVLLHHPFQVSLLPAVEFMQNFHLYWLQFLGVLGGLSMRLPHLLYTLWSLAVVSALLALTMDGRITARARFSTPVAVVAILASAELIFLALYLTWTPVGMARIDGIQGRYFIPLLPIMLFVIPGGFALRRFPLWIWWIAPIAALVAMDATIPRLIAARFYG